MGRLNGNNSETYNLSHSKVKVSEVRNIYYTQGFFRRVFHLDPVKVVDVLIEGKDYSVDETIGTIKFECAIHSIEVDYKYWDSILDGEDVYIERKAEVYAFAPQAPSGVKTFKKHWVGTTDEWPRKYCRSREELEKENSLPYGSSPIKPPLKPGGQVPKPIKIDSSKLPDELRQGPLPPGKLLRIHTPETAAQLTRKYYLGLIEQGFTKLQAWDLTLEFDPSKTA